MEARAHILGGPPQLLDQLRVDRGHHADGFELQAVAQHGDPADVPLAGVVGFPVVLEAGGDLVADGARRRQHAANLRAVLKELRGMVLDLQSLHRRQAARMNRRHAHERVIERHADVVNDFAGRDRDTRLLEARQEMLYYLMYKPVGVETSNVDRSTDNKVAGHELRVTGKTPKVSSPVTRNPKPETAPTVRDLLPPNLKGKIYPVGRLDKDSEGLLLFTNDGVLAYRLTHPKFDHEKEYEVMADAAITDGQLRKLTEGITLSGEKTKPTTVTRVSDQSFRIALTEGKYRQIRRMVQKVGRTVVRLIRIRVMTLTDARLRAGQIRELTKKEKDDLLASISI